MDALLIIGTILGAGCGALHSLAVYRSRLSDGRPPAGALYHAAWTFALWTVFGGYLLILWLIGAAGMGLTRAMGSRE